MASTARTSQHAPDLDRLLPAEIESEKLIIGAVLRNQRIIDGDERSPLVYEQIRSELRAEEFHLTLHAIAWRTLDNLWAQGFHTFDYVTLATELKQRGQSEQPASYWMDLTEIPDIVNLDFHVTKVKTAARKRRGIRKAQEITARLYRNDESPDQIFTSATEYYGELRAEADPKQEYAPVIPAWPEPLREAAYHGLAGEFVKLIEPHSEADPVALLMQFLVGWGSLAGRGPYMQAEADRHHTSEYICIIGATSKARKGTSWGYLRNFFRGIDAHWLENRLLYGLGSGEALIDKAAQEDRRLLIHEGEFARLLAVINRDGNTISSNMRNGWDHGLLEVNVRQKEAKVPNAHLSMIAHITRDELLRRLSDTEAANGFGNRILWVCARRSKMLPHGGSLTDDGSAITRKLQEATRRTRKLGDTRIPFDRASRDLWSENYERLSEGQPGLLGAITGRAEAHVLRLSLIYALLDCAREIRLEHLEAALEVWRYCYDSARFVWGAALGDSTADSVLTALREQRDGLTRWEISNHFGRHKPAAEIDRVINMLTERGLIRSITEETGGRDRTRYKAA